MAQELIGPAEGKALRRLIEKWRKVEAAMDTERYDADNAFAPDVQRRNYCDGKRIGFKYCADELEAALAPLSGPVDASGEPESRSIYKLAKALRIEDVLKHAGESELVKALRLFEMVAALQIENLRLRAAAVPSPPAQDELVEELAAQFITAIEHDPAIATDMASVESWLRRATALPPSSPVADSPTRSILVDRDADVRREMRAYLDTLVIHGDNIGDIRRSLFVPYPSQWNGWVREDTAERELSAPSPSAGANKE